MIDLLRRTRRLLDRHTRHRVLAASLGSLIVAVLEIGAIALVLPFVQILTDASAMYKPGLVETLAERLGASDRGELVTTLGLAIIGVFVVRAVVSLAFTWWEEQFLAKSETRMGVALLDGYLRAPYVIHLRRNSAELIRNVQSSTATFYGKVVQSILTIATESMIVLGVAILLFALEPLIATFAVLFFVMLGIGYYFAINRRAMSLGVQAQDLSRETLQLLHESLDATKEIKVRRAEPFFVAGFTDARRRFASVKATQTFLQNVPRYYLETMMIASVMGLSIYVERSRSAEDVLQVLGLFAIAGFRVMPSVTRILVCAHSMKMGQDATLQVDSDFAEIARWQQSEDEGEPVAVPFERDVRLEHVTYRYPGAAAPAITDIDLTITRGEWVGFVGASGAGKTTLVDVLLGLLEPVDGRLLVDGVHLEGGALAGWQRRIGYVPQTIHLLDGTLRRNIAFGQEDDEIDDSRVREAIESAQLDTLIDELPDGLDTRVGERGIRFSGGERQRIGIARALYYQPDVVVLDEATSSLDSETESRISATIERLRATKTMITVAHRLSTLRSCDRLVLIEGGAVSDIGSFEDLDKRSPVFAEFVRHGQMKLVAAD